MCPPPDTFPVGRTRGDLRYTGSMATLARSRRPAPGRDHDALPADVIGHIVDGELVVLPRPEAPHVEAAGVLHGVLFRAFWRELGDPGGWVILPEPKILFGKQVLVPDLAGWKVDRYVRPRKGPYEVAPDWVCEILSPSTAGFDRGTKLPVYSRAEVGHTWLLDPVARFLEVLRRQQEGWLIAATHGDQEKVRAEPFEAIEIDLSLLWWEGEATQED